MYVRDDVARSGRIDMLYRAANDRRISESESLYVEPVTRCVASRARLFEGHATELRVRGGYCRVQGRAAIRARDKGQQYEGKKESSRNWHRTTLEGERLNDVASDDDPPEELVTSLSVLQQPDIFDASKMLGPVERIASVLAVMNRRISPGIEQNASDFSAAVEGCKMQRCNVRIPMRPHGIRIRPAIEKPLQ